ncbi:hypothetical protein DYB34_012373 [Aphanomyces astaci]|uniref:Transcription factor IIIC 90kDa subunit N-terminal domain-containing protein n=1 Tax=Aphanomyces astaci TaxID=112090 RepID=A0A3R7DHV4_APHAT|nr:hypothetical protein DYB34_012373 [Aphanomyces astaci]
MISTYLNKDLSRFLLHPPFLTRYFLPLPAKDTNVPEPPTLDGVHEDGLDAHGTTTYRILNEQARKQSSNPREISLTKGEASMTFTAAVWGSAPNMSCAIATLTSSGQVGVYYPSTLDLQWKEVVSVSSLLKRHVAANSWSHVTAAIEAHNATDLLFTVPLPRFPKQQKNKASINPAFDAKRQKLSASFVDKVELQSVTMLAWPTATYDPTTGASMSYVALCGKRLSTVWRYEHNYAGTDGLFTSRLDESPVATAVTGVYGWPTCIAWMLMETDAIVVGSSSGNVLMMRLTRQEGSGGRMALEVERVLRTPQLQPVYVLHYSLSRVCVAAGNTITVWPIGEDEGAPLTWQAHSHNISCLDVDHCDELGPLVSSCFHFPEATPKCFEVCLIGSLCRAASISRKRLQNASKYFSLEACVELLPFPGSDSKMLRSMSHWKSH